MHNSYQVYQYAGGCAGVDRTIFAELDLILISKILKFDWQLMSLDQKSREILQAFSVIV